MTKAVHKHRLFGRVFFSIDTILYVITINLREREKMFFMKNNIYAIQVYISIDLFIFFE